MSKTRKPDVCYRITGRYSNGDDFYLIEAFETHREAEAFLRLKREQMLMMWRNPPKMTIVKFIEVVAEPERP